MRLVIDFEVRSFANLKKVGAYKYAEHPSTKPICLGIKQDDDPACVWLSDIYDEMNCGNIEGRICKDVVLELVEDADEILAHNMQFEYVMWPLFAYGVQLPLEKCHCTAAWAAYHALPRNLEEACQVLGLTQKKDAAGSLVMRRVCIGKGGAGKPHSNVPDDLRAVAEYCKQDVEAEAALAKALRPLPDQERKIWLLDMKINRRGVKADLDAVQGIAVKVEQAECELNDELQLLTDGKVDSGKCVKAMTEWLASRRCALPNVQEETVGLALKSPHLPADVRQVLNLRQWLAPSAPAKLRTFEAWACEDGRSRGMLLYFGAQASGRWSGRGPQPQNFYRGTIPWPATQAAIHSLLYDSLDTIRTMWGPVLEVAASCLRALLIPEAGKRFRCVDFESIEARALAWLAGEHWKVKLFAEGGKVYETAASWIFGIPVESISKESHERQVGKTAELACVAEGQLVLTDVGYVPIEKVCSCMRVWDGVDWALHEGAIYRGWKEVITHDELCATGDHVVYTEDWKEVELQEAARSQQRILQTRFGWFPVRYGGGHTAGNEGRERLPESSLSVFGVRDYEMDLAKQFAFWKNRWVPEMQSAETCAPLAPEAMSGSERQVWKVRAQTVQKLWRPWSGIPLFERLAYGGLGEGESRSSQGVGAGSDRQQRELRTGEPSVGDPSVEQLEQAGGPHSSYASNANAISRCPICGQHLAEFDRARSDKRADSEEVRSPKLQAKRQVWDILNAGPRHRFVVAGKVVHNCGYMGGYRAFAKMGKNLGVYVPEGEAKEIVKAWRDLHPAIVRFWYAIERAAINAVVTRQPQQCGRVFYGVRDKWLLCRLPSGRLLHYFNPRVAESVGRGGRPKQVLSVERVDPDIHQWGRRSVYGGLLVENIIQGMCRDIMAEAMVRLEEKGYPVILTVHDELLTETPEGFGNLKEFETIVSESPAWTAGMPISAKGWEGYYYRKG